MNNWNIFFTLILSLLFMWGLTQRKRSGVCVAILALVILGFWNFYYSFTGVTLMAIFYFCRNKPTLSAALYCLSYLPAFWGSPGDPLALMIGSHAVDCTTFSLLVIPLIVYPTHTGIKINKWFFYAFYPAHFALIVLVKFLFLL